VVPSVVCDVISVAAEFMVRRLQLTRGTFSGRHHKWSNWARKGHAIEASIHGFYRMFEQQQQRQQLQSRRHKAREATYWTWLIIGITVAISRMSAI
jgi:hypothetical protein